VGPLKQDYSCMSFISVIYLGRLFCIFYMSEEMKSVSKPQEKRGRIRLLALFFIFRSTYWYYDLLNL
jgi:hypothetical protein